MEYEGIIMREGEPFTFSNEELNQVDKELKFRFGVDPNTPLPFNEVSNLLYENIVVELKIKTGYKTLTKINKCTGILIDGTKDKKLAKHGVHIIDLTRIKGEWDIKTSDILFDSEVLCKIGDVEKNGIIYKALQCFPTCFLRKLE